MALKDSVFTSSPPARHSTEMSGIMKDTDKEWMRHSADVSDPFPYAAFNLERDGLHTCSFMEFRVGDFVRPVDSQHLPEALVLKNFQHLAYAFGDLP